MKISEMSTEKALDTLCEISPHVLDIMGDDELISELRNAVSFKGVTTMAEKIAVISAKFSKLVQLILKKKRSAICEILAILNETTADDIARQNIIKTMSQIREITKDKELLDFFKSCTSTEGSE